MRRVHREPVALLASFLFPIGLLIATLLAPYLGLKVIVVSILFESYCNLHHPPTINTSSEQFQFSQSLIATQPPAAVLFSAKAVSILPESYCNIRRTQARVFVTLFQFSQSLIATLLKMDSPKRPPSVSILPESYCNRGIPLLTQLYVRSFQFSQSLIATFQTQITLFNKLLVSILPESYCNKQP